MSKYKESIDTKIIADMLEFHNKALKAITLDLNSLPKDYPTEACEAIKNNLETQIEWYKQLQYMISEGYI